MPVSKFLYTIFLFFYQSGISLYSFFSDKAKKWVVGRRDWKKKFAGRLRPKEQRIWIHCSSLGEFEQGRPLIESLKEKYGQYKIVLTFFSPSGYEIRKDYDLADYVFYLPLDGRKNAQDFVAIINPVLVVFVKYEFWFFYLRRLRQLHIPVVLISAVFRESQPFFKWYGIFFRKMIACFNFIFVQDERSLHLLSEIAYEKTVMIAGDTRYDRVSEFAKKATPVPGIDKFGSGRRLLVAGSTWPEDEKLLSECLTVLPENWKMILAPHEIEESHLRHIEKQFPGSIRFSALQEELNRDPSNLACEAIPVSTVLIIDNIGMLSSLYAYGEIAFIGGGFRKAGIHNLLEPAVFGLPLIFGPEYRKFVEACELVSMGLAFPVHSSVEACQLLQKLTKDERLIKEIGHSLVEFVKGNSGATQIIMQKLADENWLKSLFLHC
jgi:3-deoxy-D-manno-octulosonic-acid transferase